MLAKTSDKILLTNSDVTHLERQLVLLYLEKHKINWHESPILCSYLKDISLNDIASSLFVEDQLANLKDLEHHLEMLIPANDRQLNGAFFTPEYVVDFIIREISPEASDKNLDPSCGCGAFLIGLASYYNSTFGKSIRETVRENLFGSDILEYNIHRCKVILAILALQHDEVLLEEDFNLWAQDSLRATWMTQFDNIVGNPPYVRFQDLSDETREFLQQHYASIDAGTFNLYFAFFELGFKLLKEHGKLGFITPNNYFTSLSGESLRRFFQQTQSVKRILDFSHVKVFDAQTYTAITFLDKKRQDFLIFDRIKEGQSPLTFLGQANGSPNYFKDLSPKKWRLLKSDEAGNIRHLETCGVPIGRLFDICVGIATLKDEVYFVDDRSYGTSQFMEKKVNGVTFHIESGATRNVFKISDFKSQMDLATNTRRIIFPYQIVNGSAQAFSEEKFAQKFPGCYEYLCAMKEILGGRDKGKSVLNPFFAWGRTQGLTRRGKKILTPTFSQNPRFLLVEDEDAFFTNGYGIFFRETKAEEGLLFNAPPSNPLSDVRNIGAVQKILNSSLMHYYVIKTSVSIEGGYPCYQKNFIEKFSIPLFSEEDLTKLHSLDDKHDIDMFLMNKYQISIPLPNRSS
jgi:methylase of polypeptide subunit release factors